MSTAINIGNRGEDLAKAYLLENNFTIRAQNYRFKRSEIDIIAEKNGILIFFEVKTRKNAKYGNPEDFVNDHKAEVVSRGAQQYMEEIKWIGPIRFDIISIILGKEDPEIEHFKDAF